MLLFLSRNSHSSYQALFLHVTLSCMHSPTTSFVCFFCMHAKSTCHVTVTQKISSRSAHARKRSRNGANIVYITIRYVTLPCIMYYNTLQYMAPLLSSALLSSPLLSSPLLSSSPLPSSPLLSPPLSYVFYGKAWLQDSVLRNNIRYKKQKRHQFSLPALYLCLTAVLVMSVCSENSDSNKRLCAYGNGMHTPRNCRSFSLSLSLFPLLSSPLLSSPLSSGQPCILMHVSAMWGFCSRFKLNWRH